MSNTKSPTKTNHRSIIIAIIGILLFVQLFFLVKSLLFKPAKLPPPHVKRTIIANEEKLIEIINSKKITPTTLTATPDQKVIFRNMDRALSHTVTMDYVDFDEITISPDSEYTFVFTIPGRFMVFIDGNKKNVGEIIVR